MRRGGLLVAFAVSAGLSGCGSSGGGGTGGNGGAAAQTGASGNGGAGGGSAGTAGGSGTVGAAGTTGSGGGGGSGVACGDATGPNSGENCNSVTTTGPCVTQTFSTAAPPSPAGGTFSEGTYNATSITDYVAADAAAQVAGIQRQTFVLSNVTATSLTLEQAISSGTILYRSRDGRHLRHERDLYRDLSGHGWRNPGRTRPVHGYCVRFHAVRAGSQWRHQGRSVH